MVCQAGCGDSSQCSTVLVVMQLILATAGKYHVSRLQRDTQYDKRHNIEKLNTVYLHLYKPML